MRIICNRGFLCLSLKCFICYLIVNMDAVTKTASKSRSKLRALPERRLQNRNIAVAARRTVFAKGSVGECCCSVQSTFQMHFMLWDVSRQLFMLFIDVRALHLPFLRTFACGIIPHIETCIFVHAPHHLFKAAGSRVHLANLQHKAFSELPEDSVTSQLPCSRSDETGNSCCGLPLKAPEEDGENREEIQAAAAKEICSCCSCVSFYRSWILWIFTSKE